MMQNDENRSRMNADWTALQAEIDAFARDLDGSLAAPADPEAGMTQSNVDLRTRFATIRDLVGRLRAQSMDDAAFPPDRSVRSETDLHREAMRRQRREQLRGGARDVGEGLVKAWSEVSAAVRKAAERIKTDRSPGEGGSPPPSQT